MISASFMLSKRLPGAHPLTGGVPYKIFVDAAAVPQMFLRAVVPTTILLLLHNLSSVTFEKVQFSTCF